MEESFTYHTKNVSILTNEHILEGMSGRVLTKTIRIQKERLFYHIIKDKEVKNMGITGKVSRKKQGETLTMRAGATGYASAK